MYAYMHASYARVKVDKYILSVKRSFLYGKTEVTSFSRRFDSKELFSSLKGSNKQNLYVEKSSFSRSSVWIVQPVLNTQKLELVCSFRGRTLEGKNKVVDLKFVMSTRAIH